MDTEKRDLRKEFSSLRSVSGGRHREIAEKLNVSEGELIAAHVEHSLEVSPLRATRLAPRWMEIIVGLEKLGRVMALTRNEACVHETIGEYRAGKEPSSVSGEGIELRAQFPFWAHGFAVIETTPRGDQRSLQFFDYTGQAIHKTFLKPESSIPAYEALVKSTIANDQHDGPPFVSDLASTPPPPPGPSVGHAATIELSPIQVLRTLGEKRARSVRTAGLQAFFEGVARAGIPVLSSVGSSGAVQRHHGTWHNIAVKGPWLNVLDDTFNLHLRSDIISSAWVVRHANLIGGDLRMELFDQKEKLALTLGAQGSEWKDLLGALEK